MNKKFVGATAIVVVTVGGLVYYRHILREKLDKWLLYPGAGDDLFLQDLNKKPEEPDAAS